jgi:hypothetical protein
MVHRGIPFFVVCLAVACGATIEIAAANFQPQCEISFRHIASQGLDIESCPAQGDGATDAQRAQNTAKNNLCATGRPVLTAGSVGARARQGALRSAGAPE